MTELHLHMTKLTWINILHFYQPPTADNETVILAAEKSYKRIIGALKRNPKIKFTVNLAGCLLEKSDKLGYQNLISDIKMLHDNRQIELTGTAAFHSLLPLLPAGEIKRNIETNQAILKKYFGESFSPAGFFSPELAYSAGLAAIIKSYGYQWLMLDEISAMGELNKINFTKSYREKNTGLKICFRSRALSRSYTAKTIFNLINGGFTGTAITATDAELYGLRHEDHSGTFEKLLHRSELETKTVSEFLAGLPDEIAISPIASSWESTQAELKKGLPYALWQNKNNKIQKLLWQLAELAIGTVNGHQADRNYSWARHHLDRGLASCTFWWASARDFELFGGLAWNPDEIERGLNELIRSIRALTAPDSKQAKIAGEKLYIKIKTLIWHKHWHYYWK
ncbi:MAG: hypothetical protein Q7R92_04740 [bacterium]|nr:hypothetical protein [bacterium]